MQSSWHTTLSLLAVDRLQLKSAKTFARTAPILTGILNLFFCAYAERFLEEDTGGRFLSLFLFLEGSLFAGLVVVQYLTVTDGILRRVRVFPTSAWSRFVFMILSGVRRPVCVALWATTSFALILLYRNSVPGMIFAPLFYTFLILDVQVIGGMALMSLSRRGHPATSLAALSALLVFALLLAFLVFEFESLLTGMPFLSWAVVGTLEAERGNAAASLFDMMLLSLGILLGLEAGRRWS